MCTRKEFSEFVKGMKCIYTLPSFLPDLESIEVWYIALQHFSYSDLKRAFASYYPINSYPPAPADLIGLIVRPSKKTGILAWDEVIQAKNSHGHYDETKASDCVDSFTRKIVNIIGGWEAIRNCPPENMGFLMKQFIIAYDDKIQQETITLLPEAIRQTMLNENDKKLLEE